MSRAYQITVRGSVQRIVHIDDSVSTTLDLLPILGPERTSELLAAELRGRGFFPSAQDARVWRRVDVDSVALEIDTARGTVKVKSEGVATIAIERTAEGGVIEERKRAGERILQESLDHEVQREARATEDAARKVVADRLEKKLGDVRSELDTILTRVTANALRERAAQIGEIESMTQDPETGELLIKVRL